MYILGYVFLYSINTVLIKGQTGFLSIYGSAKKIGQKNRHNGNPIPGSPLMLSVPFSRDIREH